MALKTYLSDINNNWLNSEWIDGNNGINAITAISTENGSITIDEINLSKKIYEMLNRIAVSDGTLNSYIKATYDIDPRKNIETPVYMGGMAQDITFQEVINNSGNESQPLGTLALYRRSEERRVGKEC